MQGFLIRTLVVAAGLWLASHIVGGIEIRDVETLIAAALLLGIVNAILRPILIVLTLPVTLVTLGLFLLVINGLMIELVGHFLKGFSVAGLGSGILASLVVTVVGWFASGFIGSKGKIETIAYRRLE